MKYRSHVLSNRCRPRDSLLLPNRIGKKNKKKKEKNQNQNQNQIQKQNQKQTQNQKQNQNQRQTQDTKKNAIKKSQYLYFINQINHILAIYICIVQCNYITLYFIVYFFDILYYIF
jgi:hypothetical protein